MKMDQVKPVVDKLLNQIGPLLHGIHDDFLKAISSWDYITVSIVVILLLAAIPSFLWIGIRPS